MSTMSSDDSDFSFVRGVLATMLDASDEGHIVLDDSGRCRMIGRRAAEMFGIASAKYVGKPGAEVLEAFASACDGLDPFWRAVAAPSGPAVAPVEIDVRRPLARTVLCKAIALPHPLNGNSARIVLFRDITIERAAESSARQLRMRLRALMPFDGLTGLLNQRRLYEELGREHSRSTRAWDSYALLRVDIDGMKGINDDFGARSGDQLIEQVARRLETCVREYDVLARLDGDEFGVLLPGADALAARAVGERMTKAVTSTAFTFSVATASTSTAWEPEEEGALRLPEPLLPMPFERSVAVSVGGALWIPPSRQSAEAIFRRAGDALREAHRRGIGTIHLYESS